MTFCFVHQVGMVCIYCILKLPNYISDPLLKMFALIGVIWCAEASTNSIHRFLVSDPKCSIVCIDPACGKYYQPLIIHYYQAYYPRFFPNCLWYCVIVNAAKEKNDRCVSLHVALCVGQSFYPTKLKISTSSVRASLVNAMGINQQH